MTALDPSPLLCIACGYALVGLDHDRPCPECGCAIAHSAAVHRIGSRWQQRSGGVLAVALEAVLTPFGMMRRLRPDGPRDWPLMVASAAIAAAVPSWLWAATVTRPMMLAIRARWRPLPLSSAQWLAGAGVIWPILALALLTLILICTAALRTSAPFRARGLEHLARAAGAHASLGLIAGAALSWIVLAVPALISLSSGHPHRSGAHELAAAVAFLGLAVGVVWMLVLLNIAMWVQMRRRAPD